MKKQVKRKPKKQLLIDPIDKCIQLLRDSWEYTGTVEYEYDRNYNCEERGCDCICRCSEIVDLHITAVNEDVVLQYLTHFIDNELLKYCIERILINSNILNEDCWTVGTCGGYYGEEITGPELEASVVSSLTDTLDKLRGASDLKRVKVALEAEYGYIAPSIKGNDFDVSIVEVPVDAIRVGNDDYMRKVKKEDLAYKADYKLPRAVCLVRGVELKCYVVCDGYHRTTAAILNGNKTIKVVALEAK